jgi:hypothetical protein
LYTLRKINFPLHKRKHGRNGNYILKDKLIIYKAILPQLEQIWKQETTYKEWIQYFKTKHVWSKSRISKFMSRRLKSDNIPYAFFELLPPPPSSQLFDHLCNNDCKIRQLFEIFPKKHDIFSKAHTFRNKLKQVEKFCKEATKTLLTS